MPDEHHDDDSEHEAEAISVDPTLNTIFTAVFLLEIALVFAALLSGYGSVEYPMSSIAAAGILAAALVGCYIVILIVKSSSGAVGKFLSRRVFPGDPLAKARTQHKFKDQMWQLGIHASMTALESYVLFYENGTEGWWTDYVQLWTPHPLRGQVNKPSVHVLYLLQMAIWLVTCFQHRFIEERHKDYFLMYTHHLVTIALVGCSYFHNYMRIGVIILYLHDISDIPVDLLKIFNYCQLEKKEGLFLLEGIFATNLVTWAYYRAPPARQSSSNNTSSPLAPCVGPGPARPVGPTRARRKRPCAGTHRRMYTERRVWWSRMRTGFWLFFKKAILDGVIIGGREIPLRPDGCMGEWSAANGGPYARGYPPTWKPGDGSFDLWTNVRAMPFHECIVFYWESTILLLMLQCMHIVWYLMFWRSACTRPRPPERSASALHLDRHRPPSSVCPRLLHPSSHLREPLMHTISLTKSHAHHTLAEPSLTHATTLTHTTTQFSSGWWPPHQRRCTMPAGKSTRETATTRGRQRQGLQRQLRASKAWEVGGQ